MTDRINAAGYTTKCDVLLARQITAFDQAQNESLDGVDGGTISPAVAVQVDGAGIGGELATSTLGGAGNEYTLSRSETAHVTRLLDTTSITDVASAQPLQPTADKFEVPNGHTNNLAIELDTGSVPVPVAGDMIEVYRRGTPGQTVDIYDDVAGSVIATCPAAGTNQAGTWFAKFVFTTVWSLYHCSIDTVP